MGAFQGVAGDKSSSAVVTTEGLFAVPSKTSYSYFQSAKGHYRHSLGV